MCFYKQLERVNGGKSCTRNICAYRPVSEITPQKSVAFTVTAVTSSNFTGFIRYVFNTLFHVTKINLEARNYAFNFLVLSCIGLHGNVASLPNASDSKINRSVLHILLNLSDTVACK
jgi:hypothetical protein